MSSRKSIFVTGAASGIGRETALQFARQGWFVGIVDVNRVGLLSLQEEIGESNCCVAVTDVANSQDAKEAVSAFTSKTGGRMDVRFNNAGIVRMGLNEEISIEDQHRIVDINFKGILNCIHASLSSLKNTPGSRIINMSSATAIYGAPQLAVYSSTKHAVKALTEALDIELEQHGVSVCDVMAPYVSTPLITDAAVKAYSVGKMGVHVQPHQVAETVWKAAHGHKLHWMMTNTVKLLALLCWALPFARRSIVKTLSMPPQ